MPVPRQHDVDGWRITMLEPNGARKNYHVEASDTVWGRFAEAYGQTATEAINGVCQKTELDREELMQVFDL